MVYYIGPIKQEVKCGVDAVKVVELGNVSSSRGVQLIAIKVKKKRELEQWIMDGICVLYTP